MWKAAIAFAIVVAAVFFLTSFAPPLKSGVTATDAGTEKARIQRRLELIEELLRARDVSRLGADLQERRRKHLDTLHAYWQRGEFPRNTNRDGERVPFFIDAYGTPCAVGHLIIESGERELATSIAASDNNVYADRITDPRFAVWAATSGLDPEELTLIQPSYDFVPPAPPPAQKVAPGKNLWVGQGMVCYPTADTFLMRDTTSSCGAAASFCTTPLRCFSSITMQYLGGSVATCRSSLGNGASGGATIGSAGIGVPPGPACPTLQACADDPRQEFIAQSESWRWQSYGGREDFFVPHKTAAVESHR